MVRKIRVKAVGGIAISHPVAGAMRPDGATWPLDQFTMRRLAEKSIEEVKGGKTTQTDRPAQQK